MASSVLITGTSSGFGRVMAETLATKGHSVYASMRGVEGKNQENAAELRQLASDNKWTLEVIELDIIDDDSVQKAVSSVIDKAGQIDVVVNNAGIATFGLVEAFSMDQIKQQFEVNVFGTLRVNQAVLPHMRENGAGYIIYICSDSGRILFPGLGVYSGSKYALEAIAETAHSEMVYLGIDSTLVQPGNYNTSIGENIMLPSNEELGSNYGRGGEITLKYMEYLLNGDFGDPKDLAEVVVKLIDTPSGKRPLRVPMGSDLQGQLEEINQVSAKAHGQLLEVLGLDS